MFNPAPGPKFHDLSEELPGFDPRQARSLKELYNRIVTGQDVPWNDGGLNEDDQWTDDPYPSEFDLMDAGSAVGLDAGRTATEAPGAGTAPEAEEKSSTSSAVAP